MIDYKAKLRLVKNPQYNKCRKYLWRELLIKLSHFRPNNKYKRNKNSFICL